MNGLQEVNGCSLNGEEKVNGAFHARRSLLARLRRATLRNFPGEFPTIFAKFCEYTYKKILGALRAPISMKIPLQFSASLGAAENTQICKNGAELNRS